MPEPQKHDSKPDECDTAIQEHPLQIWTSLCPGDVVVLRLSENEHIGTIETKTSDGLIIWIRDTLNDRKLFHFRECKSVQVINQTGLPPVL